MKNTINELTWMLSASRYKAGKSQQYMADALGVSKKTIQNWEDGTSYPSDKTLIDWFNVLSTAPHPYILALLYPDMDFNNLQSDKDVDKAFENLTRELPVHVKKKLLFILTGAHGSSPVSVLDMVVAHLQTPLRDRLNVCQHIIINYEMAEALDMLSDSTAIRPSIDNLKQSLEHGVKAVRKRLNTYINA